MPRSVVSNHGRRPVVVDDLVQKSTPRGPRVLLHVPQRAAAALVRHQQHVQPVVAVAGARGRLLLPPSPVVVEKKADDVEARRRRPANIVQGEPAEVVAARERSAVRHQEAQNVDVAAAAGDVHNRLSEFVGRVLCMETGI